MLFHVFHFNRIIFVIIGLKAEEILTQGWKNTSALPRKYLVLWWVAQSASVCQGAPKQPMPWGMQQPLPPTPPPPHPPPPPALLGFPTAALLHVHPPSLAQFCAWAWRWWLQHRHISIWADEAIGFSSMRSVKPEQVCSKENRQCYTISHLHYILISHFQMNRWTLRSTDTHTNAQFCAIS